MQQQAELKQGEATTEPALLLIVGTMRSGTTLLNRVLHAHPSIGMVYEQTNFLKTSRITPTDYVATWVPRHPQLSKCEVGLFQDWLRMGAGRGAEYQKEFFYRMLLKQLLPDRHYQFIGEKYAGSGREVEELLSFTSRCKIIAIVRDPRDVFLSNKKRIEQESSANVFHSGAPLLIVDDWAAFCSGLRPIEQMHGENCLTLKYEDLVSDYERSAARVFEFLGVPSLREPPRLEYDDGRSWSANTSHGTRAEGVSDDSVGTHARELSAAEMLFIQCLLAEQMKYQGYELQERRLTPDDVADAYELYLRFGRAIVQEQRAYSGLYSMSVSESVNGKWFMERALRMAGLDAQAFLAGVAFCLRSKGALPADVNRGELAEQRLAILEGLSHDKTLAGRLESTEKRLGSLAQQLDALAQRLDGLAQRLDSSLLARLSRKIFG